MNSMMKRKEFFGFLFLILLAFMAVLPVKAENQENDNYETWLQTVYTRESGLSAGEANAVAATEDGILWVGTYAGLYRYNGSRFQLMNQYETVKNVNCLYVDEEDRLWVGTNDQGLSVFQNEQLIATIGTEQGLPSDSVRSIVMGEEDIYYIGTSDSMAMVHFDGKELTVRNTIERIKYADKITTDGNGRIVTISSYGTMFLLENGEIRAETQMKGRDRYTSCIFDISGDVHVGTSMGYVYVYQLRSDGFVEQAKYDCNDIEKVNNLIRVNADTIFVCADNGIGYFDGENRFHKLETQNFNSSIYNVILDYQGNLWFTSSRMGLLRLCKTSFVELFTEYSVTPAVVNTIERQDEMLYVGTDSGLVILDEKNHTKVSNDLTKEFSNIRIRQIFCDSRNHLWFCTYGSGLAEFNGTSLKYYNGNRFRIGSRVRTMIELETGELLVSSENGITFLKDGQVTKTLTEEDGLLNQINLCLLEMEDGTVLVGSDGSGIARIRDKEQVEIIGKKQGLPSEVVLRMVKDQAGEGVFVVTSNALCYLNKDDSVQILNHFPYSNNYDLIQQDDTIFVLGSAGIYAVLRDELLSNKEFMNCTFLDAKAGLHSALVANSWILHEPEKEKAYLATSSGTTTFDLKAYDERPVDFRVRIASISIDGEESMIESGVHFSFSRKVNRLEIKPEIINYSTVNPMIMCYLEGFDRHSIIMPQSDISPIVYTNLPSGKYTFHITLVDSESGVSVSEKVYYLESEKAFRDTIWFYILVIGAVVLVITWVLFFAVRRLYRMNLAKKEKELEYSWTMSRKDELTGLKNRFAMRMEFPEYVGKTLGVTMMDVDYFKKFNDTYGHEMGDRILKEVGCVIQKYDMGRGAAFRYGGDEFLFWDLCDSMEEAKEHLAILIKDIEKIHVEGYDFTIHVSTGCAFGTPNTEKELRELAELADQRLYENKKMRTTGSNEKE